MKKKIYIVVAILFVLVPLGLLTDYSAWGEWDMQHYKELIGFIPQGIEQAKGIKPIIPDYGEGSVVMYYLSAIVGVSVLFGIFYILAKFNKGKN
jgi:hypothetical protein